MTPWDIRPAFATCFILAAHPSLLACRNKPYATDWSVRSTICPPRDSQTLSLTGLTHDTRDMDLPDLAEPDPGKLRDKARFKLRGGFWWATSPVGSHDMTLGYLGNLLLQIDIFGRSTQASYDALGGTVSTWDSRDTFETRYSDSAHCLVAVTQGPADMPDRAHNCASKIRCG